MTDSYTFTTLTESDWPRWLDMLTVVFPHTSRHYFETHWLADPRRDPDAVFLAKQGSDVIASVRLHWREITTPDHAGTESTPIGGVGEVATLPEHRGRGLATALLQRAMSELTKRGIATALLHTSSAAPLYQKLGFVSQPLVWLEGSINPADTVSSTEPLSAHVAPLDQIVGLDHRRLHALYAQYTTGRFHGCVVRSNEYWEQWVHPGCGGTMVALQGNTNPVAYMSWRQKKAHFHICDYATATDQPVTQAAIIFDALLHACVDDIHKRHAVSETTLIRCPQLLVPEGAARARALLTSSSVDAGWMQLHQSHEATGSQAPFLIMDVDSF